MDWNPHELLDLAADEPPRWLSIEAIRRRAIRRRVTQAGVTGLVAMLVVGLGASLSLGAIKIGAVSTDGTRRAASPPRYYVAQDFNRNAPQDAAVVRARTTGRVTAIVRNPRPGTQCGNYISPASNRTFFMTCQIWRSKPKGPRTKITFLETLVYRFQLTSAGKVTHYSLVKGSTLKGDDASGLAAAPDGSEIAVEVLRPTNGVIYTNTVPTGVFVIDTATGSRAFWHSGPYKPGANQYGGASAMSFTGDGTELVIMEARCLRSRTSVNCPGRDDTQVRAYSPAAGGGSLEKGRVLLNELSPKPAAPQLSNAFISPDGSTLTGTDIVCPKRGTCTLSVAQVSVSTKRVVRVLYQTRTGTPFEGVFLRFFSADPSVRYFILDAGAGKARVNGWIDHGKLVPLHPADGNDASNETW
ncbi:MAG TPA: hypothetical protein VFQ44_23540 [Streptosporangiaceae bacterium]|nr:hypothetical protein [Streptosporangiaceae bacterium]